jgi:hypothetical protein
MSGSVRLFTDVEVGLLERPTRPSLISAVRRLSDREQGASRGCLRVRVIREVGGQIETRADQASASGNSLSHLATST